LGKERGRIRKRRKKGEGGKKSIHQKANQVLRGKRGKEVGERIPAQERGGKGVDTLTGRKEREKTHRQEERKGKNTMFVLEKERATLGGGGKKGTSKS